MCKTLFFFISYTYAPWCFASLPIRAQSVLGRLTFLDQLEAAVIRQFAIDSTWLLLRPAGAGRLRVPSAGGDADESDQRCQAGDGDLRKTVAPQWAVWVVRSGPRLLKGSRVKSDTLKPTDANTGSLL